MANSTIVIPLANSLYAGLMSPAQVGAIGSNPDTTNASNILLGSLALPNTSFVSVGNSIVNNTLNATAMAIGTGNSTAIGVLISNTTLTLGNSIVNSTHTSSLISIANSTVNTQVGVASVIVGAGNSTATGVTLSNSSLLLANSTVNTIVGLTSISVGTINSTAVGMTLSNTSIMFGNSTVNTTANSTHFFSGNSSVWGLTNSTAEAFVSASGNNVSTPTSITISAPAGAAGTVAIGNTLINSVINSTALAIGAANSTTTGVIYSNSSIMIGNSTVNAIYGLTSLTVGTVNSTAIGASLSNSTLTVGNSSVNTVITSTTFGVANTAANGSYNLPGGYHIAFGLVTTNSQGGLAVTFANAFATNAYSVTATITDTGTSFAATVVDRVHIGTVTKTGFTLWSGNSSANAAAANIYFQAIGY